MKFFIITTVLFLSVILIIVFVHMVSSFINTRNGADGDTSITINALGIELPQVNFIFVFFSFLSILSSIIVLFFYFNTIVNSQAK